MRGENGILKRAKFLYKINSMGLFFPSNSNTPAMTPSAHPVPHTSGHVTKHELAHDVHARLTASGLSPRKREILEVAAEGHLDSQLGSTGISYKEKGELMDTLSHDAHKLGLESKDLSRFSDAMDRSM